MTDQWGRYNPFKAFAPNAAAAGLSSAAHADAH